MVYPVSQKSWRLVQPISSVASIVSMKRTKYCFASRFVTSLVLCTHGLKCKTRVDLWARGKQHALGFMDRPLLSIMVNNEALLVHLC